MEKRSLFVRNRAKNYYKHCLMPHMTILEAKPLGAHEFRGSDPKCMQGGKKSCMGTRPTTMNEV